MTYMNLEKMLKKIKPKISKEELVDEYLKFNKSYGKKHFREYADLVETGKSGVYYEREQKVFIKYLNMHYKK